MDLSESPKKEYEGGDDRRGQGNEGDEQHPVGRSAKYPRQKNGVSPTWPDAGRCATKRKQLRIRAALGTKYLVQVVRTAVEMR